MRSSERITTKYRVLEERVIEVEMVVDRCLRKHGSHLPTPEVAVIKAAVMRTAEGLLCLLTAEELSGGDQLSKALRSRLAEEIEADVVQAINDAMRPLAPWVN